MGGAIPEQVVLCSIRRQAMKAIRRKPVNSVFPWLLLQFLLHFSALSLLCDGL